VKLRVEIGRLKNRITSYLKREDVYQSLPQTTDRFSATRRRAILSLKFNDDRDLVLKTMMKRLEFLENQCIPLDDEIRKIAKRSDDVKLIMTIPGVDFYLASLISSFIRDVSRVPSDDHLASSFGIVPVTRDSADIKRRGRMSRDGPSTARWTLSIMVDNVMKYNEPVREHYQSVKNRTGSGRMAHVATMRKLTRMLYHMLKTREHWRWERKQLTTRKISNLGEVRLELRIEEGDLAAGLTTYLAPSL